VNNGGPDRRKTQNASCNVRGTGASELSLRGLAGSLPVVAQSDPSKTLASMASMMRTSLCIVYKDSCEARGDDNDEPLRLRGSRWSVGITVGLNKAVVGLFDKQHRYAPRRTCIPTLDVIVYTNILES
jgi:hypothetical protein